MMVFMVDPVPLQEQDVRHAGRARSTPASLSDSKTGLGVDLRARGFGRENEMRSLKTWPFVAGFLCALFGFAGSARATDISGTIDATLTIFEDSQLVGDVTCTVTGAPCIAFGAPGITLKLNRFTMTGLASPLTPCDTSAQARLGLTSTPRATRSFLDRA
jgi:hypothetical protein